MDNIQKLREKVEKDPKSTVFVRLAEELKKTGQLDEAVEVLKNGIERQPGYMSARVALGKIYMDKEMPDEAKTEFMQVVESAPDNLFARKKLAELYRAEGDIELAIKHYRKYLSLSPLDDEVHAIVTELKKGPKPQEETGEKKAGKEKPVAPGERPSPLKSVQEQEAQASEPAMELPPAIEALGEDQGIDAEDVYLETSPYEEDEAEGFVSALSEQEQEAEGEEAEEASLSLQEKDGETAGHGVEFKGFDLEGTGTPEVMGQNDIDSMIEDVAGVPEEPSTGEPEVAPEEAVAGKGVEAMELEGIAAEEAEEEAGIGLELEGVPMGGEEEMDAGVVELSEEDTGVELEGFFEPGPQSEELVEPAAEAAAPPQPAAEMAPAMSVDEQFAEADALVEQEEFGKAMEIYRRLLARDADNAEVRQRADELRGLVKLLGKDREIVEARLMAFLESLQRKKHEFFGSS